MTWCGTGYSPSDRQATTIYALPEDVLLDIFFCYKEGCKRYHSSSYWAGEWHLLVHICQRWRQLVFASPLRLDLQILCTAGTPVGKNLGIWPALPIYVHFGGSHRWNGNNAHSEDNIATALEHVGRVCNVDLLVWHSELEKITRAMQKPFPVLKTLYIHLTDGTEPLLPGEFLGGSAPRLQEIYLEGVPFLALPTLLLSTSDLVRLYLCCIPQSGHISPEAMVVGLAALPRLRLFVIMFQSASPRPDQVHPPPITRTVLPALTHFEFEGANEYVEDFVARIDAPQLNRIYIEYIDLLVDFRVAQLPIFMDRSVGLKSTQFRYTEVTFESNMITFRAYSRPNHSSPDQPYVQTSVVCGGLGRQVLHIAQVVSHVSATISNVVHLEFVVQLQRYRQLRQLEGTDDVEWLHLFHQFSAVQTLRVSHKLAGHVALALESITGETVAEALSSLDLIYLADQPASSIGKFVAARCLSDHPITVVETLMEFEKKT